MEYKCCYDLNHICNIYLDNNDYYLLTCCQYDRTLRQPIKNFNFSNFFYIYDKERKYYYENQNTICKYCKTKKDKQFLQHIQQFHLYLNISHFCNFNCVYCLHGWKNKRNIFHEVFIKNREKFEDLISNKKIDLIISNGGELYSNKYVMELFLTWKEKYNKKIGAVTNMSLFNPNYPIDYLSISWHKCMGLKMIEQLKKIPNKLLEKKILITFLVSNDLPYAWHLHEVTDLIIKYISKEKFKIIYKNICGEMEQIIPKDNIIKNILKIKDLGYDVKYQDKSWFYDGTKML